ELLIDGDAERLKQAREIGGARARAQDCPDRVHEIVAHGESRRQPAADDFFRKRTPASFVRVVREHRAEPLSGPRVQDISRSYSPSPLSRPPSPRLRSAWPAGPAGESRRRAGRIRGSPTRA